MKKYFALSIEYEEYGRYLPYNKIEAIIELESNSYTSYGYKENNMENTALKTKYFKGYAQNSSRPELIIGSIQHAISKNFDSFAFFKLDNIATHAPLIYGFVKQGDSWKGQYAAFVNKHTYKLGNANIEIKEFEHAQYSEIKEILYKQEKQFGNLKYSVQIDAKNAYDKEKMNIIQKSKEIQIKYSK